jgi:hypothetical protein
VSEFICTECGAEFGGTLAEASTAAFEHTAEHGYQLPSEKTRPLAERRAPEPSMQEEIFHTFSA